jgi:hypothetical protein
VQTVVRNAPVGQPTVLVGHSGAGPFLPAIAGRMDPSPAQLVFVDAGVPPTEGTAPLIPDQLLESLRDLARNGMLPKWSEWFGTGAMQELVPDDDRRSAVVAELPELPLSYFDGRLHMPSNWSRSACAYILLSEPYRRDAAEAASRGWPVVELPGGHLDMVTRPTEVVDADP